MRSVAYLVVIACLLACGGRTESSADDRERIGGETGSSGSTRVTTGGTNGIGEIGGAAAGGHAGAPACLGGTVTITVVPSAGSETHWCLGKPATCAYGSDTLSDANGPLSLSKLCTLDCESCEPADCHSIICGPVQALNAPVKLLVWDGTNYALGTSSCARSASCVTRQCAPRGVYSYTFQVFVNPAPDAPDGCARATRDTLVTTTTATFWYPDQTDITIGI